MTYATLMVHLALGRSNAGLLRIAGDLAEQFHASLLGVAACQPMQVVYADGYVSGDLVAQDREELEKEIKTAEAEFRGALSPRFDNLEWRAAVTLGSLSGYLAQEARNADLIVTTVDRNAPLFDASRHVDVGDLAMRAGRPVLVVPAAAGTLKLGHVLIAWKDTRETRRAALDALPLLKKAARVTVVEIAAEADLPAARTHLEDVVAWLGRHGVGAEFLASPATGDDATRLAAIARDQGADLVVAGAYGHSRLREWAFGGVTREVLLRAERCSLMSH